jgi:glycosyltransferase involved in cell wall biosynthesis
MRPTGAKRVAVTAYDLIPLEDESQHRERWHRRWIYGQYLEALKRADRVIAISYTTADIVAEKLEIDRRRIDVVYPVVTHPLDTRAPSRDEPTFLFVGVPDAHKRPYLAISALAAFRRNHGTGRLRFIGPLAPGHLRALRTAARNHGVSAAVTIEGSVPPQILETAYASATAVLAVSRVEGFGLPAVEAILRGVPVVAADTPITREVLGESAQIVEAEPEALAAALASAAPASAAMRRSLGDRYSLERAVQSLTEAYDALANG